jgi:hypothetical protein
MKPKNPMDNMAYIMPNWPKTALEEKLAIIWLIIPKAGSIKI